MRIILNPQRRDDTLELESNGVDRIRVNGELFNFNPLNDGDIVEASEIPSEFFTDQVRKIDGEIIVTLLLPHGPNPEPWQAFPDPISVSEPGPVDIPTNTVVTIEEVSVEGGINTVTITKRWQQPDEVETVFTPNQEEPADVDAD